MPADNPATGIVGVHLGDEILTEADHFMPCLACGQLIDCRELDQVFHHMEDGHKPIPEQ